MDKVGWTELGFSLWDWAQDLLYHVLPLNHLHGIVVALLTTLWAGAAVELLPKLNGEQASLSLPRTVSRRS